MIRERAIALYPKLIVSLSSDVSPRYREYERASTVVANAYVKPIVKRYVERLEAALKEAGKKEEKFVAMSKTHRRTARSYLRKKGHDCNRKVTRRRLSINEISECTRKPSRCSSQTCR